MTENEQQEILDTVYAPHVDPMVFRRFYISTLQPHEKDTQFHAWFDEVITPLEADIAEDTARQFFLAEIGIDEFVEALNEDQLDAFLEKFPALQDAFVATHQEWWN